jgi:hypothetical protein
MDDKKQDEYSTQETRRRVEAAVHGAFNTSVKPLKDMATKRPALRKRSRGKAKRSSA